MICVLVNNMIHSSCKKRTVCILTMLRNCRRRIHRRSAWKWIHDTKVGVSHTTFYLLAFTDTRMLHNFHSAQIMPLYRLWDGEIQGHTGQPSVWEIEANSMYSYIYGSVIEWLHVLLVTLVPRATELEVAEHIWRSQHNIRIQQFQLPFGPSTLNKFRLDFFILKGLISVSRLLGIGYCECVR